MSEQELVRQAQAGDFDAFVRLVDVHKPRLYNLALKMTGNSLDAEDIVQETLMKAIDKIDQFRGEASFGTWLYSIALNQTRATLVREKRADLRPLEEYLPFKDTAGSGNDLHHNHAKAFDWKDPHELLEQDELRTVIDAALAGLPVKYREAFVLRYIDELSVKEVAGLIGESVAATKSRILRARVALRDHLSKVFEDRYGQKMR